VPVYVECASNCCAINQYFLWFTLQTISDVPMSGKAIHFIIIFIK